MPDINELENRIEELSSRLDERDKQDEERDEKIETLEQKPVILDRNLDTQSKIIIEQTISDRILDIVWDDYFYYFSTFEGADGWDVTSEAVLPVQGSGMTLQTKAEVDDRSNAFKSVSFQRVMDFDNESRFRTLFYLDVDTVAQEYTLDYDAQSANFTVGATLTGGTSNATAIIVADSDSGATGTLTIGAISGTFQNDETITDDVTGSATSDGTVTAIDTIDYSLSVGSGILIPLSNRYGFRLEDNKLYGICSDGSTESKVELLTTEADQGGGNEGFLYLIEARFYPGTRVDFFVSDVNDAELKFKTSLSDNLPSGIGGNISYDLYTRTARVKRAFIDFCEYIQIRPKR